MNTTKHDSNISNPNNSLFFVAAFNAVERSIWGAYLEKNISLNNQWRLELGLRHNTITMDAGTVDGTPATMNMMGMMPGRMLRDTFNQSDRSQHDNNIDWVAKIYYDLNAKTNYYLGIARKSRAPSYQERYLWIPLQATAGLADGRTYTGNITLDSEISHEIEFGFDWQTENIYVSPRLFYRSINDYIQGIASNNNNAIAFVQMMNMMNGTMNTPPLEFNNVDANLYGFDMDWSTSLTPQWALSGVVSYVRGKRGDVNDNLYRIAPLNTRIALHYNKAHWQSTVETITFARQRHVSNATNEQTTDGYTVLNWNNHWIFTEKAKLGFGIENLTDRNYSDHLFGKNRIANNSDIPQHSALPGNGRNVFIKLDYQW